MRHDEFRRPRREAGILGARTRSRRGRGRPAGPDYWESALIEADAEGGNAWRRTPVSQQIAIERRRSTFAAGGAA